ncbi:MAG: hypothetical protein KAR06_01505 [Deltaproteobacteria bacterium]|nr:hypothetical protein [Deltaproteobacteria bacterium]
MEAAIFELRKPRYRSIKKGSGRKDFVKFRAMESESPLRLINRILPRGKIERRVIYMKKRTQMVIGFLSMIVIVLVFTLNGASAEMPPSSEYGEGEGSSTVLRPGQKQGGYPQGKLKGKANEMRGEFINLLVMLSKTKLELDDDSSKDLKKILEDFDKEMISLMEEKRKYQERIRQMDESGPSKAEAREILDEGDELSKRIHKQKEKKYEDIEELLGAVDTVRFMKVEEIARMRMRSRIMGQGGQGGGPR